jgi:hypothetical protein
VAAQRTAMRGALLIVVCACMIVGAQGLASASAPPVTQLSQTKVLGQTGFAYLAGLRLVAAGLLNRNLEIQFHQFGKAGSIKDRVDLIPATRMIQLLNPQLEQPYYYVSFVLAMRGDWKGAISLAEEGIRNNPTSGLLRANYVQMLVIQDRTRNLPMAVAQMRYTLSRPTTYSSVQDQYESYGIFRGLCLMIGDTKTDAMLAAEQERLSKAGGVVNPQQSGGIGSLLNSWQNSAMPAPEQ